MARVTFKKETGIERVSGTIGGLTYRTRNGQIFIHSAREPFLPKKASRAEKARYKREVIVNQCVRILQDEMEDWLEAIRMRPKIRDRIVRLYGRYVVEIKAPTKLQIAIMREYRQKYGKKTVNIG